MTIFLLFLFISFSFLSSPSAYLTAAEEKKKRGKVSKGEKRKKKKNATSSVNVMQQPQKPRAFTTVISAHCKPACR